METQKRTPPVHHYTTTTTTPPLHHVPSGIYRPGKYAHNRLAVVGLRPWPSSDVGCGRRSVRVTVLLGFTMKMHLTASRRNQNHQRPER